MTESIFPQIEGVGNAPDWFPDRLPGKTHLPVELVLRIRFPGRDLAASRVHDVNAIIHTLSPIARHGKPTEEFSFVAQVVSKDDDFITGYFHGSQGWLIGYIDKYRKGQVVH